MPLPRRRPADGPDEPLGRVPLAARGVHGGPPRAAGGDVVSALARARGRRGGRPGGARRRGRPGDPGDLDRRPRDRRAGRGRPRTRSGSSCCRRSSAAPHSRRSARPSRSGWPASGGRSRCASASRCRGRPTGSRNGDGAISRSPVSPRRATTRARTAVRPTSRPRTCSAPPSAARFATAGRAASPSRHSSSCNPSSGRAACRPGRHIPGPDTRIAPMCRPHRPRSRSELELAARSVGHVDGNDRSRAIPPKLSTGSTSRPGHGRSPPFPDLPPSSRAGLPSPMLRFPRPLRRQGMNVAQHAFAGASALAADELALRVTEHYERRGRELWGLARRLGATDEQAADVVQEVHLRLWHELSDGSARSRMSTAGRSGSRTAWSWTTTGSGGGYETWSDG